MMHWIRRRTAIAAAALWTVVAVSACSDTTAPELGPAAHHHRIAQALAAALDDDGVRESVHRAMQQSQFLDHKLVFQEFLNGADGQPLRAAVISELGGEAALADALEWLPGPMDFYVPFPEHRHTWEHADDDVVVVSVLDPDARQGLAFRPNGESLHFTTREAIHASGTAALFVLHPAEAKGAHEHDHGGPTIHPPPEGDGSGRQAVIVGTAGDGADGAGTYVTRIESFINDGLFNTTCEFYFKTDGHRSRVVGVPASWVSVQTVNMDMFLTDDVPFFDLRNGDQHMVDVELWEADSGALGDDDYYGTLGVDKEGPFKFKGATVFFKIRS